MLHFLSRIDPLFPMTFLINSWVPGMMDAILQTTFLCAVLMFWLCVYHGLRQVWFHFTVYNCIFYYKFCECMIYLVSTERKTPCYILFTESFGSGFTVVFGAYSSNVATLHGTGGSYLQLRSWYIKLFCKLTIDATYDDAIGAWNFRRTNKVYMIAGFQSVFLHGRRILHRVSTSVDIESVQRIEIHAVLWYGERSL